MQPMQEPGCHHNRASGEERLRLNCKEEQ